MLSLAFRNIENNTKTNNWAQAFKPIELLFDDRKSNIEWTLKIYDQNWEIPIEYYFEYPEDQKVIIIIQDSSWSLIRNSLKNYLELFGSQKTYLKSTSHMSNFRLFCLKNWLKQGVIVPNMYFMDWKCVGAQEIVEVLKNEKRGLIWVLIGLNSRIYYDFIDQNEDKIVFGYAPENNFFQQVNDILKEAGEKEIDWRIWL